MLDSFSFSALLSLAVRLVGLQSTGEGRNLPVVYLLLRYSSRHVEPWLFLQVDMLVAIRQQMGRVFRTVSGFWLGSIVLAREGGPCYL